MATLKQFESELAKHPGAALDADTADYDFYVDAPRGYVWNANFGHVLCAPHNNYGQSFKGEAYADLIERMGYGTEPCETPDCEICHATEEDS